MTPIRVARLADPRKLSQSDVARGCGIVPSFYNKIEAGTSVPSAETAAKLAAYLNHAISEMQILYPERYAQTGEAA